MSLIHRLTSQSAQFDAELRTLLAYEASEDESIEHACAQILHRIQHEGDTALLDYTQRFDRLTVEQASALEIPKAELLAALESLPANQRKALEQAAERVRRYHEHQRSETWTYTEPDGTVLGQQVTPLDRV